MQNSANRCLFVAAAFVALLLTAQRLTAQDPAAFEQRMTKFTLDNGLTFLAFEHHDAPTVACHVFVNAGAVDEAAGKTGLAHLLEHLAFKGTRTIGTKSYDVESQLLAKLDAMFDTLRVEERTGRKTKAGHLTQLRQEFTNMQREAQELAVPGEWEEILQRAGGIRLNARTNYDSTVYVVSLPSNRLELWMLLESDRFLHPVLRDFYKEKDVVMEERRERVESNPVGRLGEEFVALAYRAHPYGRPTVGYMSDLQGLTRAEAQAFFDTYYGPGNLTIAMVGDIDPHAVRELAQAYFDRIPYRPRPEPVRTVEPPQIGERRVVVVDAAQSILLMGYHKPDINHPDDAVFSILTDIAGSGRTARLYRSLVQDKRIALHATSFSGTPGNKYPGLYVFYAVPAKDHTNRECEEAILAEIDRLKNAPVSSAELQKAKTRARVALLRSLASNRDLASQLAFYEAVTGDWHNIFSRLNRIDQVDAGDIQRVARTWFTTKNRTIGMIETVPNQKDSPQEQQK